MQMGIQFRGRGRVQGWEVLGVGVDGRRSSKQLLPRCSARSPAVSTWLPRSPRVKCSKVPTSCRIRITTVAMTSATARQPAATKRRCRMASCRASESTGRGPKCRSRTSETTLRTPTRQRGCPPQGAPPPKPIARNLCYEMPRTLNQATLSRTPTKRDPYSLPFARNPAGLFPFSASKPPRRHPRVRTDSNHPTAPHAVKP